MIQPVLLFLFVFVANTYSEILSQWRGPNRDGYYPATNLLVSWPKDGPDMLWSFEGLGAGHSSAAIAHDRIYVAGKPDSIGVLYAFDMAGKLLWKQPYGLEWTESYSGARSTPTVVDNYLYLESGHGVVLCFDACTGKVIWSVDLLKTFFASNIEWGMAESLLIDGDRLICTPGGPKDNVVALNRFTGETIWTSPGHGEPAAYCSPILIDHNGTRLIITMTAKSIIGIDAENGTFYWRIPQYQRHDIHANTPVYINGKVICSSASEDSNDGIVVLNLSDDGKVATVAWRKREYENLMGGVMVKEGYIYGAAYRKKEWYCLDIRSGTVQYINKDFGGGVITWSDGLFYLYSDRGQVALADITPTTFEIISSFEVPMGTNQHWAHPVIQDGRLYIRHGDALMVYDIAE